MIEVSSPHIRIGENGQAYIGKTRSKVKQVVIDKTNGMDAEAIHDAYPHLSLAEIYAAFSYYYDHKDEIDAEIARDDVEIEEMRKAAGESPLVQRLRAEGKLP